MAKRVDIIIIVIDIIIDTEGVVVAVVITNLIAREVKRESCPKTTWFKLLRASSR